MRIGIVAPPWVSVPPPAYGGTESVIDRLARGLVGAGHDVLLWTTGDSTCPVERRWVLDRAETDRMGFDAIELHHLIYAYDALSQWGADVIHDHTLIGPVFASRHPDLRVVTTNHGAFDEHLVAIYRAVGDSVPVIAISHDHASRSKGAPIAAVIHHGIDLDRYPEGDGSGDDLGEYFLFLGRMAPEKGARRAVLAAQRAGVRLLLAAKMRDPLEHQFFREQVQPLLDDDTVYLGEVGEEQKISLLRGAQALVNPIRWPEPFGLVMIEALACGTPVLAFPEGSAPELVDHGTTGFLCDDVDDLARRIGDVHLLDRGACRQAAVSRFSTARMVADHLVLFERVVTERSGGREASA